MKALLLLFTLSPLLLFSQTVGQWELRKRGSTGMTSYGVTAENGKAIGFTAGVPAMIAVGGDLSTSTAITGITSGYALYNNAGVLGGLPVTALPGSGTASGTLAAYDTGGTLRAYGNLILTNSGTSALQIHPTYLLSTISGSDQTTLSLSSNGTVRSYSLPATAGTGTLLGSLDTGTVTSTIILDATIATGDLSATAAFDLSRGYNPKAYGSCGIARRVTDATTTNGDQTVTSATGNFTAADVGAIVWCDAVSGGELVPVGTVTAINSTTSIEVSVAATFTQTGAGCLVLGFSSQTAVAGACAAAAAAGGGTVILPPGGYILTADCGLQGSSNVHVKGSGEGATTLYLPPDFDIASTGVNKGICFEGALSVGYLTIEGNYHTFSGSGSSIVRPGHATKLTIRNINGFSACLYTAANNGVFEDLYIGPSNGYGIYCVGSVNEFHDTYVGNCYVSVFAQVGSATVDTGSSFKWFGGLVDESSAGSMVLDTCTNGEILISNAVILGPDGNYAVTVTGGTIARFANCAIHCYTTSGNRGGLSVAAASTAHLSNSRLKGSGTRYAIDNAGTVYDGGNVSVEGTGLNGTAMTYGGSTNIPVSRLNSGTSASSSTFWRGDGTWAAAGAGTVTSVAQSFTGGLISVAGSPITSSGTLALTVAGTSGGIPYFSSGTTWATSAALAANALVIGGGAGAAPATTTTGTGVLTAIGNAVNGASGLLTYGLIGTSGTKLPLLDGTNTWSGANTFNSTIICNGSAGAGAIGPTSGYGFYFSTSGGGYYVFQAATVPKMAFQNASTSGLGLAQDMPLSWVGNASVSAVAADLFLIRDAAAVLQIGLDLNGDAIDQTFKAADGITGTDKNGADLTLASGNATGTGTSALIFSTPAAGSTGTTARTAAERLRVTSANVTFTALPKLPAYTVATLPSTAATGMVAGAMAYVTDALAPTYGATVVGGGAIVTPVFYDGTNWTCH